MEEYSLMMTSKSVHKFYDNTFKQLSFEEKVLYNASTSAVRALKSDVLNCLITEQDNKRKEEVLFLHIRQNLIHQSIMQLHKNISTVDKIKSIDMMCYERHVKDVCSQIEDLKSQLREQIFYFIDQQSLLEEEVKFAESLCNKLDTVSFYKNLKSNMNKNPRKKTMKNTYGASKDVENFQEYLFRNGGHTGGWGEEEHRIFKKYWYKYGMNNSNIDVDENELNENEQEFLKEFQRIVPDKNIEDILSHIIWKAKYDELKNKQSEAISRWKETKEYDSYLKYVSADEPNKKSDEYSTIRDELKRWQIKKEDDKKADIEVKAENAIKRNEVVIKQENKRRKEKDIVTQWLEMKKKDEEKILLRNVRESSVKNKIKSATANRKVKEFILRDQTIISNRLKNVNEYKNKRFTQSLSNVKIGNPYKFEYHKGNYAAFTKQWKYRIAKNNSFTDNALSVNEIDSIPKLKIPNWRQGLAAR